MNNDPLRDPDGEVIWDVDHALSIAIEAQRLKGVNARKLYNRLVGYYKAMAKGAKEDARTGSSNESQTSELATCAELGRFKAGLKGHQYPLGGHVTLSPMWIREELGLTQNSWTDARKELVRVGLITTASMGRRQQITLNPITAGMLEVLEPPTVAPCYYKQLLDKHYYPLLEAFEQGSDNKNDLWANTPIYMKPTPGVLATLIRECRSGSQADDLPPWRFINAMMYVDLETYAKLMPGVVAEWFFYGSDLMDARRLLNQTLEAKGQLSEQGFHNALQEAQELTESWREAMLDYEAEEALQAFPGICEELDNLKRQSHWLLQQIKKEQTTPKAAKEVRDLLHLGKLISGSLKKHNSQGVVVAPLDEESNGPVLYYKSLPIAAIALGVSQHTLRDWLRGRTRQPYLANQAKLSDHHKQLINNIILPATEFFDVEKHRNAETYAEQQDEIARLEDEWTDIDFKTGKKRSSTGSDLNELMDSHHGW